MFRETSFLLNAESIVQGGHQQDLLYLVSHQVVKDIPVGILLGQEFLQQHSGVDLLGVLKLAEFLPNRILLRTLLKHLAGLLTAQVIGNNAGQVLNQLTLLFQKGPFVHLGKGLQVEHLDGSFPPIDGLKLLYLPEVPLTKTLTGIILSFKPDPGHRHFGVLPGPGYDGRNLCQGLFNGAILLDGLGGLIDTCQLLEALLPLSNQPLNVLFGPRYQAHCLCD